MESLEPAVTWSNKRRQGNMQSRRRIKYKENPGSTPTCLHCAGRNILSQYPPRPRLTRIDIKYRSLSSSSASSTSKSMASPLSSMTETRTQATSDSKYAHTHTCLPEKMEETLHLQDLELMMHWCTTTYKSLARDAPSERIWQTIVPNLSLRCPALRHGLLALSALHLASSSAGPSRRWRYLDTARSHRTHALNGLRQDSQDLTDPECNATFALCCIMLVFAFGYCILEIENDEPDEDQPGPLDEFFEVFQLTRWLLSIQMRLIDRISVTELRPLIAPDDSRPTMPDMSRLVVLSLRRQNSMESERDPAHPKDLYDSAIEHLSNSLEQLMKGGEPRVFAFCWSFRVPEPFLDLMTSHQPFALVVLAHYAVILHHLRDMWWMGDWGTRILREIGDLLEPEWRELINWPIDATGCFIPA
ncbi:hypothetical protein N7499_001130 [Penicillium canescens]|uniref:uncharacterized protein n=1 Tax=Penicillium canescens TaxID=5083 RepID=UPI0026DEDE26|nr:uncharacterized protein N7446_003733 [Penicillium canescens]KAJ6040949.1 hypothetical protein N7444_009854 [Penicillium canescens]KAJ6066696.1 hypothetical protein N7446_003733 [Penicillium canescens]KAJ6101500.1 hypothetical protein N7499_001130 [Penicillium canescens]